ncbi:ParA family protein [Nitrincola sp.]|uniref:ParA family protein n=1 Tax=Nitrincola sp. TaxID=1926584 RepID=UPI003A93AD1C
MNSGKIIVAASGGKGGVGKTSMLVNLAGLTASKGFKVCLIDSDTGEEGDGSEGAHGASTFGMLRSRAIEQGQEIAQIETYGASKDASLTSKLKDLSSIYDYVFVDTPGSTSKALSSAIAMCDHLLLPMDMQRDEFLPLPPILRLVESLEENFELAGIDRKIDTLLVGTRIPKNYRIYTSISAREEFLTWYQKRAQKVASLAQVIIPGVVPFKKTVSYGRTIHDLDDKDARQYRGFVERLMDEIEGRRDRFATRILSNDETEVS